MSWQIVHEQMSRADGLVMLVYDYLSSLNSRPAADPRLGRLRTLALNRRVSPSARTEIRRARPRCQEHPSHGHREDNGYNTGRCTETIHPAGPAWGCPVRWDRRLTLGRPGRAAVEFRIPGDTSRCTIPRRCRQCHTDQSRWEEMSPRARCGRIRHRSCFHRGNVPPRYSPAISLPVAIRCPRRSAHAASAARGDLPFGLGRQSLAGPLRESDGVVPANLNDGMIVFTCDRAAGPFRMPPVGAGTYRHQTKGSSRETRPAGGVNTIEPGTSFSGGASGKSLGSGGRSAIVM